MSVAPEHALDCRAISGDNLVEVVRVVADGVRDALETH